MMMVEWQGEKKAEMVVSDYLQLPATSGQAAM
jgi:hypothetical protein